MSEAALAPSASQAARVPTARTGRGRLSPLEALERGFALFRSTFAQEAWRYYSGAAPLVLCFIPIWVANGQIRTSSGTLAMEAGLLAACYLLRVSMAGSYMQQVRERAFGMPVSKPANMTARAAGVGRLLAWKIMLSVGALATLPTIAGASWFYSGCQFASLEAQGDDAERHSFTGCLALASQWFGGGLLFFVMLFPLWIAVWLNGLILAMALPELLHSIFGLNTLLSTQMGMYALIQSSAFWLSLLAGAWLAFDPIVKCTFVIVYQHLRSRREGDDLRGLLASLPHEGQKKAQMIPSNTSGGGVVSIVLFVSATVLAGGALTAPARAAQTAPARSAMETTDTYAHKARIQKLREALDEESRRPMYQWHDAEHPSPPTWFDKLLGEIGERVKHAWDAFWNFLRKLWPRGLSLSLGNEKPGAWRLKDLRLWLILIAVLTSITAGVLFLLRQRKEGTSLSIPLAVAPISDLSDSAVANERSEDEWFALATRLEGEGELRFALRAAYFGLLAGLARREWLTIRRDRTNREYLSEFARRWRRRPQAAIEARTEVTEKLRGSLRQFDQVWYGSYAVTPQEVATYLEHQRELLNHV
jgi:hypothetical protein